MSNPKIKRFRRRERYTTIDNGPLERTDLSWRAKGILTYLIGKPENWEVRLTELVKRSTEGREAVRTALRELKNAGYLVTVAERDLLGKISDNVTYVSDHPEDLRDLINTREPKNPPPGEAEGPENRPPGKPSAGKSPPNNKGVITKKSFTKAEHAVLHVCGEVDLDKKSLFKNSPVSPFATFKRFFKQDDYLSVDVEKYYDIFIEWNERKRVTRTPTGWIISIKKAIERDAKTGKVHRNEAGKQMSNQEMADFLNMGR